MKRLLLSLLAALALPTAVSSVEINCNSSVWKNKPICLEKKQKKETKPKYCENKNLTPIQEEECLDFEKRKLKELNKPLEYPVSIGGGRVNTYYLREFIPPNEERNKLVNLTHIQLRSENGSDLVIARVDHAGIGFNIASSFVDIEKIVIPKNNIIGWSKNGEVSTDTSATKTFGAIALFVDPTAIFLAPFGTSNTQFDYYQISYFDNQGSKNDFYFYQSMPNRTKIPNLIPRFFTKISGLKSGDLRSDKELKPFLLLSLENLEIERKRLEDILFISESETGGCTVFNQEKYPNLYKKYLSEVDSINELKLNLEIPFEDKKICEVK